MPSLGRLRSLLLVGFVATSSLLSARADAQPTSPSPAQDTRRAGALLFDLPVPGGLTGLFDAIHTAPPPRPLALLALVRVLHISASNERDRLRLANAVDSRLASTALWSQSSSDTVPLPLSPDIWMNQIFRNGVTRDDLVRAILGDRRASFLYYGLCSVDDGTLEFFEAHPSLVAAIYENGVGSFAGYGRSIHVKDATVVLPGGPAARPAWEDLVGEPANNAERFILALLRGDAGRRAYFLDVVSHLDQGQQAFALGSALGNRAGQQVRRLYGAVAEFERQSWRVDVSPFVRRPVDPAAILLEVQARPDGRMAPPSGQAFWRPALDGDAGGCARLSATDAGDEVDASWLVGRLLREPTERRSDLLNAVLFAQRVFATATDVRAACEAVARYPRYAGLLATLEHMGFSDARDYRDAVAFGEDVTSPSDMRVALRDIVQMQGLLAVLDRAAIAASPANRRSVQELTRSMWRQLGERQDRADGQTPPPGSRRERAGRFASWIRRVMIPKVCRAPETADSCFLEFASGRRTANLSAAVVAWQGERYRVDPASAFIMRVSRVRDQQRPTTIDTALTLISIAAALGAEPSSQQNARYAAEVRLIAGRLPTARAPDGTDLDATRTVLEGTARKLAGSRRPPDSAATDLLSASDVLLADSLASFAYAMAIGDPDSSFLLAGDPARRHEFLPGRAPVREQAWQLAHEAHVEAQSTVQGSLLGLAHACALSWQRRLSLGPISTQPTLNELDLPGFADSAAALNAFDLTDAGRTALAAAIRNGLAKVDSLSAEPGTLAIRAAEAGVSEWRVRAAVWLARHGSPGIAQLFSLCELLWLGNQQAPRTEIDPWGVPTRLADGSLGVRMPRGHCWEDLRSRGIGALSSDVADLHLRVALWLDEMKLPAALAPGIVSFATWDLVTTAQPIDADDYLAMARAAQAIPGDRLFDYVSALTADGTLVPVAR